MNKSRTHAARTTLRISLLDKVTQLIGRGEQAPGGNGLVSGTLTIPLPANLGHVLAWTSLDQGKSGLMKALCAAVMARLQGQD